MKIVSSRHISISEMALVENALKNAPLFDVSEALSTQARSLRVLEECECGCCGLYFRPVEKDDYLLVDGVGWLTNRERIGLLIWCATGGHLTAPEIVNDEGSGSLPISILSWFDAGSN